MEYLAREKEYAEDPALQGDYWQARSALASQLGDYEDASRSWQAFYPAEPKDVLLKSPLEAFRGLSAVQFIADRCDRHHWIMLGEEHVRPQTRSLMIPLLRVLYRRGFHTLAVETLSAEAVASTVKNGYASVNSGFYTADPVFAAGIREAIRLGFCLAPYEWSGDHPATASPVAIANLRETGQAGNLVDRIWKRDRSAKVIVWAGRGHVAKEPLPAMNESLRPMALEFRRLTGIDPLCVHLASFTEDLTRSCESPLYKWATDRGLVRRPTVFVGADGQAFRDVFDAQVFFPRTKYVRGRADWLLSELGRYLVPIPPGLVSAHGYQLVQVFGEGEPATAVPVDQILIRPRDALPALALPHGRFWVRVLYEKDKVRGPVTVTG
jgi:hypothetical protein